ncbi:metabotropic glutamate receptor 7-like [Gigantopelta aegis]|uniref:metabotropic glutamate receptor 7-like n=1 Tax=Gigantopelta aegis TaxID=1735272 RepID=UPI001B88BB49|nr:metabotropic glutamate receptor 7-like [Gigantopelta aegis]
MALSRAMQFMPNARTLQTTCRKKECSGDGKLDKLPQFFDVVGVLGAYTSSLSIVVANVMTLFKIPQISHTSTSDLLSDKKRFPYFLRVIPPDKHQVQAMADVLHAFDWRYVSVIFSQGSYGQESHKKLLPILKKLDICVAQSLELTDIMGHDDYDHVISSLRRFERARVVVLYAEIQHVVDIMAAVKRNDASGEFIWTGSDALSHMVDEHPDICEYNIGILTVGPYSANVPKFSAYMDSMSNFKRHDPLTLNSWMSHNKSNTIHVKDDGDGSKHYAHLFASSYLIDAVYAFAHALQHHIDRDCAHVAADQLKTCVSGESLLPYLKRVTFQGSIGQISFDGNGDVLGKIEIRQCQVSDDATGDVTRHLSVGLWDVGSRTLTIDNDKLQWSRNETGWRRTPVSVCGEACGVGEVYTFPKSTCCWECMGCKHNEITSSNATRCRECPEFYWPDGNTRRTCYPIEPTIIRMYDAVSVVLCAFASLGLISTGVVILFFHSYRHERVIRSSSRELSYMILVGILAAYLLVFTFLVFPSSFFCYLNQVGFSLTFTLLYAPLLVKTNRIYRIFKGGKKTAALPRCTSTTSQIAIVTSLLTIQFTDSSPIQAAQWVKQNDVGSMGKY